jgi:hypothetical protein
MNRTFGGIGSRLCAAVGVQALGDPDQPPDEPKSARPAALVQGDLFKAASLHFDSFCSL